MTIIDKNKIKAVIFDWGGACCKEGEPFASPALQKILGMNPDQIAAQVDKVYKGYYLGQYNRETFWRAIINHFNLSEDDEINPVALSDAYLNSYAIYQDVLDMALKLQDKYQVSLLSNLTPEMRDNIKKRHNTSKYFKPEVYSCDDNIRMMKPDLGPFQKIVEMLGVQPQECLFIDNSQKNLDPAAQIGMQTILFDSPAQLLSDLAILF